MSSAEEWSPLVSNQNSNNSNNNENNSNNITNNNMSAQNANYIIPIIIILAFFALYDSTFVVEPGNIGLIVTLGNVNAVQSGLHYKLPFVSSLIIMSGKTQKLEESNNTPTKEGLSVQLDTAM